jgi:hypothetical protein
MHGTDRINGSPHDEACTNIDSHGTANNSSSSGVIRPATSKRKAGVVPLYLIQRVVAAEINRCGRTLREIRIVRTNCHYYIVTVIQAEQEADGHD